jgi:hypothetical protein
MLPWSYGGNGPARAGNGFARGDQGEPGLPPAGGGGGPPPGAADPLSFQGCTPPAPVGGAPLAGVPPFGFRAYIAHPTAARASAAMSAATSP